LKALRERSSVRFGLTFDDVEQVSAVA
jgi:hypothetical protein